MDKVEEDSIEMKDRSYKMKSLLGKVYAKQLRRDLDEMNPDDHHKSAGYEDKR